MDANLVEKLASFIQKYGNIDTSTNMDSIRSEYLKIRIEIQDKYPNCHIFSKNLYTTSSFDFTKPDIDNEANELLNFLINN